MHRRSWSKAAKLLQEVIDQGDRPELLERARQLLAVCRQRTAEEEPAPEGEDPYLQAVFEKNRGDLDAALEICRRGGREKKDERFAYLAASIYALEQRTAEAAEALTRAVELNPTNRIHAFHDSDFAELRKDRDLRHLFGLP
jgi:tetratricopeptide (TPR) repeat protein